MHSQITQHEVVETEKLHAWAEDLPRQVGPYGDDTDDVISMAERVYPVRPHNTAQAVAVLRRGLYRSILQLRSGGARSRWLLDQRVDRVNVNPFILERTVSFGVQS